MGEGDEGQAKHAADDPNVSRVTDNGIGTGGDQSVALADGHFYGEQVAECSIALVSYPATDGCQQDTTEEQR